MESYEEEQRERARKEREAKEQLEQWKNDELPKPESQLIVNPSCRDGREYYQVAIHSSRADVLEILTNSSNEHIVEAVGDNKMAPKHIAQRDRHRATNMAWKREIIKEQGKFGYAAALTAAGGNS